MLNVGGGHVIYVAVNANFKQLLWSATTKKKRELIFKERKVGIYDTSSFIKTTASFHTGLA